MQALKVHYPLIRFSKSAVIIHSFSTSAYCLVIKMRPNIVSKAHNKAENLLYFKVIDLKNSNQTEQLNNEGRFWPFSLQFLDYFLTIGHRCIGFKPESLLSGVSSVFPLRIRPIFKWSLLITRIFVFFSRSLCANRVLPVWDAPQSKQS